MRKQISAFLLAVLLLFSFIGCAGKTPSSQTVESGGGTEEDAYLDDLPSSLNFNGSEIRIVYPEESLGDIFVEEAGGEAVDEGVYRARLIVEERLGVEYNVLSLPSVRRDYTDAVANTYLAQQDVYDIVADMIGYACISARTGAYADLRSIEYLDFTKPYWIDAMAEGFSVNGHLYFCSGDAAVSYLKEIELILCHTGLAANYQIDSTELQRMVIDGKWTAEKMKEYALQVQSIADPSAVNRDIDTVGLVVTEKDHSTAMASGMGVYMCSPDGNGSYECTFGTSHAIDVVQWMVHLFNDNASCVFSGMGTENMSVTDIIPLNQAMFLQGRALFITAKFDDTRNVFQEIAADYIPLPFPKWDESDDYGTISRVLHLTNCIMRSSPNASMAGAVLECMASVGYSVITPAYFETALKIKYSDATPESRQTFDIIRDSVVFDFGYYCQYVYAGTASLFVYTPILDNDPGWAAQVNSRKRVWQQGIKTYMDKLVQLDD